MQTLTRGQRLAAALGGGLLLLGGAVAIPALADTPTPIAATPSPTASSSASASGSASATASASASATSSLSALPSASSSASSGHEHCNLTPEQIQSAHPEAVASQVGSSTQWFEKGVMVAQAFQGHGSDGDCLPR